VRRTIINRIGLAALAGCVAVGALALAGCGGGNSSSTTAASGTSGSAPLSQDEFVSQANAVCKEGGDKNAALKAPSATSPVQDQIPTLEQEIAIGKDTVAKLVAITPPSDLQAKYAAFLSDEKGQIAWANRLLDAAKANDTSKIHQIAAKANAIVTQQNADAKALGLTECAA